MPHPFISTAAPTDEAIYDLAQHISNCKRVAFEEPTGANVRQLLSVQYPLGFEERSEHIMIGWARDNKKTAHGVQELCAPQPYADPETPAVAERKFRHFFRLFERKEQELWFLSGVQYMTGMPTKRYIDVPELELIYAFAVPPARESTKKTLPLHIMYLRQKVKTEKQHPDLPLEEQVAQLIKHNDWVTTTFGRTPQYLQLPRSGNYPFKSIISCIPPSTT